MSFYCKKFQIRAWFWAAFIGLSIHFGYTILGEKSDWFIRICVAVLTGCASIWWLWMMRTFDSIISIPWHEGPEIKDDECGNRH